MGKAVQMARNEKQSWDESERESRREKERLQGPSCVECQLWLIELFFSFLLWYNISFKTLLPLLFSGKRASHSTVISWVSSSSSSPSNWESSVTPDWSFSSLIVLLKSNLCTFFSCAFLAELNSYELKINCLTSSKLKNDGTTWIAHNSQTKMQS